MDPELSTTAALLQCRDDPQLALVVHPSIQNSPGPIDAPILHATIIREYTNVVDTLAVLNASFGAKDLPCGSLADDPYGSIEFAFHGKQHRRMEQRIRADGGHRPCRPLIHLMGLGRGRDAPCREQA